MSYLIIGASSGLGRDLAYTFAEKKNDLILVSRDEKDLTATKSDLEIKHKINVKILNFDYSSFKEINSHLFSDQKLFQNLRLSQDLIPLIAHLLKITQKHYLFQVTMTKR